MAHVLRSITKTIAGHGALILVTLAAALGVGFLISPRTMAFASTARVHVEIVGVLSPLFPRKPVNMSNELAIAEGPEVATIARQLLETDSSTDTLRDGLKVEVLPGNVLAFRYSSVVRAVPQPYSQAFAEAYLQDRRAATKTAVEEAAEPLELELAYLEKKTSAIYKRLAGVPKNIELSTRFTKRLRDAQGRIGFLRQQVLPFHSAEVTGGKMVQPAGAPDTETRQPKLVRDLGIAALVGLLLGIALAFARDRMSGSPARASAGA